MERRKLIEKDGVDAFGESVCGACSRSVVVNSLCWKLESAQMRVGRRLLEVAVQGDLEWRKLEERREEMKVFVW